MSDRITLHYHNDVRTRTPTTISQEYVRRVLTSSECDGIQWWECGRHDRQELCGDRLGTDVLTLHEKFRYRLNMYRMKEDRDIEPETFAKLMSSTLYERRFGPYFIEPVVAGLNSRNEPFIAASDLIGCLNFAKDFVVSGTASDRLFGMAEGLWEPDLEPEDLFETISQTMLGGIERDALSGMGVVVRIITSDKVIERTLKCRQD